MHRHLERNNLKVIILIVMLMLGAAVFMAETAAAATTATVNAEIGLNVRSGPGTQYDVVFALTNGTKVNVIEKSGNWYKIDHNGKVGYVSGDFLIIKEDPDYVYDGDFESYLKAQGFPESYKAGLRELHAAHPKWVFKAQKTGLDWNAAVAKQSVVGRNLIHKSYSDSWKSTEYGAYNPNTGVYQVFDSGGYVAASSSIIKYYVDPRNFLNENGIFQFMSHSYDGATQTKDGLQALVAGTFLAKTLPEENSTYPSYTDVIMYAGRNSSANPYVLASMIIVEQGANGAGNSISGRVNGYEGLYNFFNIGAFAHDGRDAVINGLIYARGKGWTTRVKSIIEGAAYYANAYINNNQNTQYLKKFNMMNGLSNVATHQYMTNIKGAADEASRLKEGYASVLNTALTFNIPVYNNMPNTVCPKPGSGNNNYYLKTLEVAGYELMPAFDIYKTEYEMIVPVDTSYASINAVPSDPGAKVTGVGNVQLTGQVTDIKVTVTSTSGEKKVYTVTVAKEANAGGSLTSSKYTIGTQITGVAFNTSVSTFKANVSVPAGYTLKLVDGKGNQLISGNVGTGTKAVLYDQNGKAVQSPVIVIKGDTNGDGKISSVDILMTQRHVISTYNLSGAYNSGADINKDGKVSSVDILMMQRHVIGTYTIKN